ncbi:MAG: HAD family hydrolase, partial [Candidatus Aegiribacteria sp.]|nr:HAD family hydrolase [Candidatus Aegiribacteria sp.]
RCILSIRKTAIFDLDGTLHHTEKALVPAIQMAMADLGFRPAEPDDINALYGEPLEVFCRKLLNSGDDTCREFRNGIRRHQIITLREKGALYPGTREMLSALKDMGFNLAVCSNADMDYIELVTSSLGIADMFSLIEGKDGHASKTLRLKKIIEKSRSSFSVMVGDRYHDIGAALENSIPSIGCLYGYGDPAEMQKANHTVSRPAEIVDVIRMLPVNPGTF